VQRLKMRRCARLVLIGHVANQNHVGFSNRVGSVGRCCFRSIGTLWFSFSYASLLLFLLQLVKLLDKPLYSDLILFIPPAERMCHHVRWSQHSFIAVSLLLLLLLLLVVLLFATFLDGRLCRIFLHVEPCDLVNDDRQIREHHQRRSQSGGGHQTGESNATTEFQPRGPG